MTVEVLIPLAFLFIALVETRIFIGWRQRGMITANAARLMIVLTLALPVILYLLFAVVFPDIGAIELL